MNPNLFGSGEQWPDGDSHTTGDITHELGHALGHADYSGCPGGTPTLMDTTEACPYTTPQALDETNYHNAYHADEVSSFSGTSPSAHNVTLTWNPSNIHNEREFLINRRDNCTGQWQVHDTAPKNDSSIPLPNQQGGLQEYQIVPLTYADPDHSFAGGVSGTTVNVQSTYAAPTGMTATFPSTTVNRFTWPAVSGADHYKIRADVTPSGVFSPNCTDNITATQYDAALPGSEPEYHAVPFYWRVMACTAADLCSPLSATYTVSERFNSGAWNYVFTYYRVGDSVNLQFVNFNPNVMALQLHIRNGDSASSPLVTDSACIPVNTIGSVGPMSAYYSFWSGKLATQGHGIYNADTCASTDSGDSSTVGWGYVPPPGEDYDSDGDGCTDKAELQTAPGSEVSGGLRDPFNFWDFFDTPDPNGTPQRDGVINISDILRVSARFATAGDPNIDPLSKPPKTGYHPAYDRGGVAGPNPWNLSPANGAIGVNEIFWVAAQFTHVC